MYSATQHPLMMQCLEDGIRNTSIPYVITFLHSNIVVLSSSSIATHIQFGDL